MASTAPRDGSALALDWTNWGQFELRLLPSMRIAAFVVRSGARIGRLTARQAARGNLILQPGMKRRTRCGYSNECGSQTAIPGKRKINARPRSCRSTKGPTDL